MGGLREEPGRFRELSIIPAAPLLLDGKQALCRDMLWTLSSLAFSLWRLEFQAGPATATEQKVQTDHHTTMKGLFQPIQALDELYTEYFTGYTVFSCFFFFLHSNKFMRKYHILITKYTGYLNSGQALSTTVAQ